MNEVAQLLVEHTAAVTGAVLAVAVLRRSLRRLFGVEAAYFVWLLVPFCHLAVALPARVIYVDVVATPVGASAAVEVTALPGGSTIAATSIDLVAAAAILWLCGAVLTAVLLVRRHRRWLRSLSITVEQDGSRRSAALRGPAVLGILRPAVVLPSDFEERYGSKERALMLAHERAHIARRDLLVNALAAAWLCLFWFNPLAHWAFGRMRFDQDLACDAVVMRSANGEKRRYAATLLATQLAADEACSALAACHWQSMHPLAERIAALKCRPLGDARRVSSASLIGIACVVVCGALWVSLPRAVAQPADASSVSTERERDSGSSTEPLSESATDSTAAVAQSVDAARRSTKFTAGHIDVRSDAVVFLTDVRIEIAGGVCIDNVNRFGFSVSADGSNVFYLPAFSWLVFEDSRIVLEEGVVGTLAERNGQLTFESHGPVRVFDTGGGHECRGVVVPLPWFRK